MHHYLIYQFYKHILIILLHLLLEVGGAVQPGNRFVSFVRASGRGGAKLRGRARGDVVCVARAPAGPMSCETARPPAARSLRGWLSRRLSRRLSCAPFRAGVVPPVVLSVVPPRSVPGCPTGCPMGCLVSISCQVNRVVIK